MQAIEIKIPSATIAGIRYGDPKLPPILAMHGWLDCATSFDHLAPLLTKHHIIAIDLPGHGLSSHRPHGCYFHITEYIADCFLVADELGFTEFTLLGHSMGAAIACLMAGVQPDRIKQLVLIDALGPYAVCQDMLPQVVAKSIAEYKKLPQKRIPCYESIDAAKAARMAKTPMNVSSLDTLVNRALKLTAHGYMWRNDARLMLTPLLMLPEESIVAFLKKITASTCLIRPDEGWPFEETLFNSRREFVKNLAVHQIPGKHHVHLDDPKTVAAIVNEFLNE